MSMSLVPFVMEGGSDPIVGRVRQRLNIPGGNELDRGLVEILRGFQSSNGLPSHGQLDEATLRLLDLTAW